jgi:hypothetical protein
VLSFIAAIKLLLRRTLVHFYHYSAKKSFSGIEKIAGQKSLNSIHYIYRLIFNFIQIPANLKIVVLVSS